MNIDFKFYVYDGKKIERDLTISKAIEVFKSFKSDYKALGVESVKNPLSIDLLIHKGDKTWVSKDIETTSFKDNKLISVNVINLLKAVI